MDSASAITFPVRPTATGTITDRDFIIKPYHCLNSGGSKTNPMRDSTQNAERSALGWSSDRPAAMNVERRIRCDDGEYEAPVTPERFVFRQNVVGRTTESG
jgi:hypothetical protein